LFLLQNDKRVCFLKKEADQVKPGFNLFLLTVNLKNVRIVVHKAVVGFIVHKGWAFERNVVKLAPEGATQLLNNVFGFPGVSRPNSQSIEGKIVGVHGYI